MRMYIFQVYLNASLSTVQSNVERNWSLSGDITTAPTCAKYNMEPFVSTVKCK